MTADTPESRGAETPVAFFVDYIYPGLLFGDTSTKRLADPGDVVVPEGCAAYTVYERAVANQGDEELLGKPKNHRPTVYFGREMNLADVERELGQGSIAAQNMRGNNTKRVVMLKNGQVWAISDNAIVRSDV